MKMAQIREAQRVAREANDILRQMESKDFAGDREQEKERALAKMQEAIRLLDDD